MEGRLNLKELYKELKQKAEKEKIPISKMDKSLKERYEALKAEQDEIMSLLKRIEMLKSKSVDAVHRPEINEQIHDLLDALEPIVEHQGPNGFLKFSLLGMIKDTYEVEAAGNQLSIDVLKEFTILQGLARGAFEILDSDELPDVHRLCLIMFELGKRQTILSVFTDGQSDLGFAALADISTPMDIQDILHSRKSAKGGKAKAERELRIKQELIKPLLKDIGNDRFTGKYRSAEEAVNKLLREEKYPNLYDHVYGDKEPKISYLKFLIPEAKKIWKETVKASKSK